MTANELKRKLAKLGCTFTHGTKHLKAELNGRTTLIPRHPSQEIRKGTLQAILKDLGIEKL